MRTILIVEDDPLVLETVGAIVETMGYKAITVDHGQEAVDILAGATSVDMVLSDVAMHPMNGTEVALRARQIRPDIRIILTSGYSSEALGQKIPPGCHFLTKPFALSKLKLTIDEAFAMPAPLPPVLSAAS